MDIKITTLDGKENGSVTLSKEIFGLEPRVDLIQRCIEDCRKVGLIKEDDEIWAANQVDMPYAYVVYDHDRPKHVKVIRQWLDQQDIILSGRYSEWEYYNSDHAFIAGKNAAEDARQRLYGKAPQRNVGVTETAAAG